MQKRIGVRTVVSFADVVSQYKIKFGGTGLNTPRTIYVFVCSLLIGLASIPAQAQVTVSGTVTDFDTGTPMEFVTVVVEGTYNGTTTSGDGTYELELRSRDDVLLFSFVGYISQRLQLRQDQAVLNVELKSTVAGLDDVVVIGTRRLPRLVTDSAVPIDVIGPRDLASSASLDIDDVLRSQIPSYNVQRHEIDGSTTFVRPPTLRGLSPDNTIVLVNGKRRHRSGSLALFGSALILGAQGPDMNMIPSIAIKQFEVLRDGASAQYGADAVAGVFNLQLRDNHHGIVVRSQTGQYHQGDGRYISVAANAGMHLTKESFLNVSLEYRNSAPTIRTEQRSDARLLESRGYPVAEPVQIWGNPDVDHSIVGFFNSAINLNRSTQGYAFGGYGQRSGNGSYYFRAPGTGGARLNVFRFGGGATATRAIADLNLSDMTDCHNLSDLPGLDSDFQAVQSFVDKYRGQCFLFNQDYPGGFTPRFGIDMSDMSAVAGFRGDRRSGLLWDVSVGFGRSLMDYFIHNTVNASFGPESPSSFRQRDFIQQEYSANLDMSYPLELGFLHSPLNTAWGVQWRTEIFETRAGDPHSYQVGPYASQGFSVGSNGDQGIPPEFTGRWERPNYAVYVDLEADVIPELQLGIAARLEDFYNDFGTTLTGKTAALWRLSPGLSLRGSISTGFRAPTPGQANLQNVQTNFSGDGGLIDAGQLPSTHPIAAALGGKQLTEETSVGRAMGIIVRATESVVLTVDYFDVSLRNRIALTGSIPLSDEMAEILASQHALGGFETLREVKFFTNDFDTRQRGLDFLLSWDEEWSEGRATIASIAYNWTRPKLVRYSEPNRIETFLGEPLSEPATVSVLSPRRLIEMENVNPHHRLILSGRQIRTPFHGLLRLQYFSSWQACLFFSFSCTVSGHSGLREYKGGWVVDLEAGYQFGQNYGVTFGINNAFAAAPSADPIETEIQGNQHPASTPWDYNGAALYLRLSADL